MVNKLSLLLLPGLLCDQRLWAQQMAALNDLADVRCADLTQDDTVECMASRVLTAAPERFALVGLSMGGLVAFEIMRQAPQRVTHLGLFNTNHRAFTSEQSENYRMFIEMANTGRFDDITGTHLLPLLTHQRADLAETIQQMAQAVGKEAFIRQAQATMSRPDSTDTLKQVRCPTRILTGRHDALCSLDWHREMAALVPDSELVIVENCGHLSSLEQPQAVSATMRNWLQK